MLTPLAKRKVVTGICLPRSLKEAIDRKRGDIPRSTYIYRILEREFDENDVDDHLRVDAANGR